MSETPDNLDRISTRWSAVHDVEQFLVRYAAAVRRYVEALLGKGPDADDVCQEFFLRVVQRGFERASPDRGRFRDYLKTAVRNAVLTHLRRQRREPDHVDASLLQASIPEVSERQAERDWMAEWRTCLLNRAWRGLESRQQATPGNLFYSVLRLTVDHADEDSMELAARASAIAGRSMRADAYRQQLRGAREVLARLLLWEVSQTLEEATPAAVEEELAETGLALYVLPFLPADWREKGWLADPD